MASVIRSSFFDVILFVTRPPCSKGMWARLWYAPMRFCNSDAGFGANIGSERSQNSLQREKMSELKKRAYETSSEEDSVLASKGSATAVKRKKVPSQKFLPAYHEAYPCLVPSRKGSELVLCTTSVQIGLSWRSIWLSATCWEQVLQGVQSDWKVFFSFKTVSFSLSPPFSLSLIFNAANV